MENVIIPPKLRYVSHYNSGLGSFASGELYGYIDMRGKQVIPQFFEDAKPFSEGLAAVKLGGRWGYIAPDGASAIPAQFVCIRGMARPFRQGLAGVAQNGKWGHINRDGEFLTAPRFDMALEFSEDLAVVELDKRSGYVNPSHSSVLSESGTFLGRFCCGPRRYRRGSQVGC
jgi:hypothetical protein